ncbi:MAG TPA: hypothetical protein VK745_26960, partial [Polyangiaceae bacterium]|nr:hypothetical protein [Polyangiaceae bacterium]
RVGVPLVAAMTFCTRVAQAAPGDGTRLEYARSDRAAHCPDRNALKSAVSERLGYDPFLPTARRAITVEITDTDAGLRAHMSLVDDHGIIVGSRELSDKVENCDELVASLALAISIALDPSAALGAAPAADNVAAPATAPKKEASESAPEASAMASVDPLPSAPALQKLPMDAARTLPVHARPGSAAALPVALRVAAVGALGATPGLAFGARVGGGVRSAWFELVAELSDQFAADRSVPGGIVQVSLLDGGLAPCWAASWFAGCALVNAGSLRVVGIGAQPPLVVRHLLDLSAGLRAEVDPVLVGPLRLLVNLDVLKSLTPVALEFYGLGYRQEVWRTPAASLAASLGLELRFP